MNLSATATPHPDVAPKRPRYSPLFSPALVALLFCLFILASLPVTAQITDFQIPTGSRTESIVLGPDGAFWFTEYDAYRVGRIDTNGVITEPFIAISNTAPYKIIVGPDTNLWFTEAIVDKIARISRGTNGSFTNGIITEFTIHATPTTNLIVSGLTVGPDGNFWFLEYGVGQIGVMDTNGHTLHEYGAGIILTNSRLSNITAGSDGNLWFTDETYGKIGRITTAGVITEFPTSYTNGEPYDVITGPDGALWYSEANSNRIGRMTTAGVVTADYVLPTINPGNVTQSQIPYRLTVGKDGNIWFTENSGGNIARITPAGVITEFLDPALGAGALPTGITSGPDGSLWFGEFSFIGRFQVPTLSIARTTNSQVILSWQSGATGFTLQGNTNLATTNWTNIFNPQPTLVSNMLVLTLKATNTEFFRLFIP